MIEPVPVPEPSLGARAVNRTMRALVNPVTGGVLASPAHGVLSGSLVELGYLGPVSGRRISLVTQYAVDDDRLVVYVALAAHKRWWRVFRGAGRPIRVRLRGTVRAGHGQVLTAGQEGYDQAVAAYVRRWPQVATDKAEPVLVITFPPGGPAQLHPEAADADHN